MDFNNPVYIDQPNGTSKLNLNSISASELTTSTAVARSGYRVLASSFGDSSATGYVDKRAVDDGLDFGDAYLGGRQIMVVVGVFGSSLGDYHSKVQALEDVMRLNPRYFDSSFGFRTLYWSQPTIDTTNYTSGLAALQMVVRPTGIPSVTYNSSHSIGTDSRGFAGQMQLNFVSPEPYKYRQTEKTISISIGSVASATATTTLANIGKVPLQPIFEIIHPTSTTAAVNITSFQIEMDSRTLKLNDLDFTAKTTASEVRWYVDFNAHAVYRGVRSTASGPYVQTLRQDVIDTQYYAFGYIVPSDDGTCTVITTWTGSTKPDTVNAKYREAYY
jgi:hypothetical protein